MKFIESIEEMREYSQQMKREGKTIAAVGTESYLHDGHMSLVKVAKENADIVVLSGFHTLFYFHFLFGLYEIRLLSYIHCAVRYTDSSKS